jgi:hypothetical protein
MNPGFRRHLKRPAGDSRNAARRFPVAKVIATRGTVAQFARDLSRVTGQRVTWARVNAWKIRDSIPKQMVFHVHKLTGIALSKLLKSN